MIDGFVRLGRFYNHPRAMFVVSLLEGQGFEVVVENEFGSMLYGSVLTQGIDLLVREEDAAAAVEYLRTGVEEELEELEGVAHVEAAPLAYGARRCPECGSTRLALRGSFMGLFLLFWAPLLARGGMANWPRRCRDCSWREEK